MTNSCSPRRHGRTFTRVWTSVRAVGLATLILTQVTPAMAAKLTVRVQNPETNTQIEGARLIAYRLKQNGKLREVSTALTDSNGEAIFKLKKLGRNARYVIKAKWQNRRLNSAALNRVSEHVFSITSDGQSMVDKRRPRVRIKDISESSATSSFTVSGIATDDSAIDSVSVRVKDKIYGKTTVPAVIDATTGRWTARFENSAVRPDTRVEIVAIAVDARGKKRKHRIKRRLLVGQTLLKPVVLSHAADDEVAAEGFTLSGSIDNPESLSGLTISVEDEMLGTTVDDVPVEVDGDSNWTFRILPEHMSAGGSIDITLAATADSGAVVQTQLGLNVAQAPDVDNDAPEIVIASPEQNASVSVQGFDVTGSISDESDLESARLSVRWPDAGVVLEPVDLIVDENDNFAFSIAADTLEAANTYEIAVEAKDVAGNTSTAVTTVNVTQEVSVENSITIDSPADGGTSAATGFTLAGLISSGSDILDASVSVTRAEEVIVNAMAIEVGADGSFNSQIETAGLNPGDMITVSVTASVAGGEQFTQTSISRIPENRSLDTLHLLSRTTFGATSELLAEVNNTGVESFLDAQLNPDSIDDSAFESFLGDFTPENPDDLAYYALVRMVSSRRQLREVMTQFWENHFNTFVYASSGDFGNRPEYEFAENNAFRANALGRFQDLLNISAKSPSMLIYLNNVVNRREDANENYARELIELHTLGVDNGYERADIEAAAEIFTGWHMSGDRFSFNSSEHNPAPQVFLGETIPEGGVEQGERLLEILATHPGTASFICTKLASLFISDNPPRSVIERCAAQFIASATDENQLAEIVRSLILSEEFAASARSKVKTPIEFISTAVRAFGATGTGGSLPWFSNRLGMRPFTMPVPTGYSELAEDWMNTNQLVERIKWAHLFSQLNEGNENLALDPVAWTVRNQLTSATEIVDHIDQMLFANDMSPAGREALLNTLNSDGEFDPTGADAQTRLRETIGIALSLPGFNYQ